MLPMAPRWMSSMAATMALWLALDLGAVASRMAARMPAGSRKTLADSAPVRN